MSEESPEKVGYRRPPKATRWKKGQSGNPRGRKPGKMPKSERQVAEDVVRRKIVHDGRTLTYLDVILMQVFKKASEGNRRATRLMTEIEKYRRATPEIWLITPEIEKQMAAEYEKRLEEGQPSSVPNEFAGMTVNEAADHYYRWFAAYNAAYRDRDD